MVDLAPQAALQTEAAAKPSIRRYYVLALLTVIYALNFLDRTIFNVLIEPIKKEFALSDTTMACSRASASCCSIRCSASRSRASHALKNDFGVQAVRYSLLSAGVTTTVGALLFIWAARSIRADIQRAG
jgi:hypothetical protein